MVNMLIALIPALFGGLLVILSGRIRQIITAIFKNPRTATVLVKSADGHVSSIDVDGPKVRLSSENLARIVEDASAAKGDDQRGSFNV